MSHLEESLPSVSRIPLSSMKDSVCSFLPSYRDGTLFRNPHLLLGDASSIAVGSYIVICVGLALASSSWCFKECGWGIAL